MCLFKILSLKKQPSKDDPEKTLVSCANVSKRLKAKSAEANQQVTKSDLFQ